MPWIEIIYYTISDRLEIALRNRELNEEQLAQACDALKEKKKKQMTSVKIFAIVMAVFFVIMTIGTIISADNILIGAVITVITMIFLAGAGYFGWYLNVGKVAKQWNKLVKEFYPQVCDKYKL